MWDSESLAPNLCRVPHSSQRSRRMDPIVWRGKGKEAEFPTINSSGSGYRGESLGPALVGSRVGAPATDIAVAPGTVRVEVLGIPHLPKSGRYGHPSFARGRENVTLVRGGRENVPRRAHRLIRVYLQQAGFLAG